MNQELVISLRKKFKYWIYLRKIEFNPDNLRNIFFIDVLFKNQCDYVDCG